MARTAGIELDPAVPFEACESSVECTDGMRYVKLRANLLHLESTLSTAGAYVAAFDGTAAGRTLLLRQQQPSTIQELRNSIARLESKLGYDSSPSLDSDAIQVIQLLSDLRTV